MRRGLLFIVSAPSGTGKTTLVERLVRVVSDLVISRSYTSRPPRPGETDGVDYNFVDEAQFASMVDAGEFLEWATVFGCRYGTCLEDTERHLQEGRDVVLVIDVEGARQVRQRRLDVVSIFVLPPTFNTLKTRLGQRNKKQGTSEQMMQRLRTARLEVAESAHYGYLVVNDSIERCVGQLQSIVEAERLKTSVADKAVTDIVSAFQALGE